MKKLIFGFVVFMMAFSLAGTAKAARVEMQKGAEANGKFDLGPTSFSIDGNPGETFTKTLQVTNRKGHRQDFKVEIEDFQGSKDDPDKTVLLQGDKSGIYSGKEWVTTELESFSLEHGERQFFNITVKIPQNADPGDHYASVLVSAPPKSEFEDAESKSAPNVSITSRVGSLFFINVKGPIKQEGLLESFVSDKEKYDKALVNFKLTFRNSGSVRLRPEGKIEINNMFGIPVGSVEAKAFNVLRDSIRSMEYQWKSDGFFMGRYTANLKLNRGYDGAVDEAKIAFWILPVRGIVILIFIVLVIIFILYYLKKRISEKSKRRAAEKARKRK